MALPCVQSPPPGPRLLNRSRLLCSFPLSMETTPWSYLVMTQLTGFPVREVWSAINAHERSEIVSRLGAALKSLHDHVAPLSHPALNRDWRGFIERQAHTCVERQRACGANPEWLERLPAYIAKRLRYSRQSITRCCCIGTFISVICCSPQETEAGRLPASSISATPSAGFTNMSLSRPGSSWCKETANYGGRCCARMGIEKRSLI